ncbi:S8 family serine peptidase [Candidatus Albibeggiatoa sp. nov. NOAA]|uniref:S8 family serine peptidase n=1 Tax=Candidatus Albibeggiatoa sp. nov. NOAA TaxID=3162724 RepID=UPI0033045F19|nr:S8 family serine peptidase [Thiotrichaceae bacterium]
MIQTIHHQGYAHVIINLETTFDLEPDETQAKQTRRIRSLKTIEPRPELSKSEKLQRISEAVAVVQGEVLIALAHLDDNQFKLSTQYDYIAALVADIDKEALAILQQHPKVGVIQLSPKGQASLTTSIPLINADDVHSLSPTSYTGDGISVAVLDSGIDTDHSDFSDGAIVDEKCFVNAGCPPSNTSESNSAEDNYGHGTHVSGIITSADGVAPNAKIVAVKVINGTGHFQLEDLMSGVDWIIANLDDISPEIRIINMSLGLSNRYGDASECDTAYPSYTETFNQLANELDVIPFASSGNNSETSEIDWPSCLSDVIAVGNSNSSDALHSSGNRGELVEIVAPGVNIVSTEMGGTTTADTGTSMSSPMAAGVAALMLEKDSSLSAALIKQRMVDNGVSITESPITYKRVDALASIQDETTQAILQLTQNSSAYLNAESYYLGTFNQDADVSKQFKLFNLGNNALVNTNFSLTGDTINLEDTFPTTVASNSSELFTLEFPSDTMGSYTGAINFDSNDPNNANFTTTIEWMICDGILPITDDFDDETGCWMRSLVDNPDDYFNLNYNSANFPFETEEMQLIAYKTYSSEDTVWFNASQVTDQGKPSAKADLTLPTFSTIGSENISINFDWYERNGSGDDDKVTVRWSEDGSNWQDIEDFDCQTSNSGWQPQSVTLPSGAEGKGTIYINFLFEADNENYNIDDDCFLANVDVTAASIPEIAIYGNGIEIENPDTSPSTDDGTDFGRVEVGSSLGMTFTIANEGQADLTLNSTPVTISGSNADQFSITTHPSTTIAANSTETFVITFTPTSNGEQSATMTIRSDDSDEGTYIILIEGEGSVDPALTLSITDTEFFEDDGSNAATGTVSRLTSDGEITVTLSTDNDKISVSPSSFTILDGEITSNSFAIHIVDDDDYTGNATVTLNAAATDYDGDSVSLTVIEDETEPTEEEEEDSPGPPPPEPDYVGVFIGSPNGRVVSEPAGIDCNRGEGSCTHVFPRIDPETGATTRITLTTIAPEGLYFAGWRGDSDCRDSKLYLNNTKRCLAYFYGIPKE